MDTPDKGEGKSHSEGITKARAEHLAGPMKETPNQIPTRKGGWWVELVGPPDPKSANLGEMHWLINQYGLKVVFSYPPWPPPKEPPAELRLSFAVSMAESLCAACRREKSTPYWTRNLRSAPIDVPELPTREMTAEVAWCLSKLALTLEGLVDNDFQQYGLWRTGAYRFWGDTYANAHLAAEESLWRLVWEVVSCLGLTEQDRHELVSSPTDLNPLVSKLGRRSAHGRRRALQKAAMKWPAPPEWDALSVEMAVERARAAELGTSQAEPRKQSKDERIQVVGNQVYVDGQFVPLAMTPERIEDALAFLNQLCSEPGNWKSSSDIGKATDREGTRFDRVYQVLPKPIKSQIESNRRKGYRLRQLA